MKIYTLVSEIHENVDLVIGITNMFELEGVKLIDKPTQNVMMLKVKFMRNAAILDIMNNDLEVLIINPKKALGILDLRSIGYYKIKQGELQQNLIKYYEFKLAEKLCDQYNNLINILRKEQSIDTGEKYPWLEDSDERKFITDREILEKYINLYNTCLTEKKNRGSQRDIIQI